MAKPSAHTQTTYTPDQAEEDLATLRGQVDRLDEIVYQEPSGDTTGAADLAKISGVLSTGHAVRLLAGQYYISTPISMGNGSSLTGPPGAPNTAPSASGVMPAKIKLVSGSNSHMISVTGNNAYIGNVELDGNKAGQSSGTGCGIYIGSGVYFIIAERCMIHDQYYRGVNMVSAAGNKILDCSVGNNGDAGIWMDSGSNDNHIRGCLVSSNTVEGIHSDGFVNHIYHNDVWGNSGSGIRCTNGRGVLISGNGIDHNQQHGVSLVPPGGSFLGDVAIVGNTFHSNGLALTNTYDSVHLDNSGGNLEGVSVTANNFWLDAGVTNLVGHHIWHGTTAVARCHGNQFQAASFATAQINIASQTANANETA